MFKKETLIWLSNEQKFLDSKIMEKHSLVLNDEIMNKKLVAFWVELGEYANEEKSFKYWKQGAAAEREVQLEEYIDGLHFILSIGNQINFDFANFNFKEINLKNNIECYLELISLFSIFTKNKNSLNFQEMFNAFLQIAWVQNFSEEELINSYQAKHQKNQQRQIENY